MIGDFFFFFFLSIQWKSMGSKGVLNGKSKNTWNILQSKTESILYKKKMQ